MTAWIEVLVAIVDGPTRPVSGVVSPYRKTDEPLHMYYGSYGDEPVLLVLPPSGVRVTRWGCRFRIESRDGALMLCADGTTVWDFRDDPKRPRRTAQQRMYFFGPGRELILTRPAAHWVGEQLAKPIGPVTDIEFLGRRCWAFTLAAGRISRRHQNEPDQYLIIDAETGAVVAQHSTDGIDGAAYVDLDVADIIDLDLFRWDGLVVTDDDSRALAGRPAPNRQERGAGWFRENVTDGTIELSVVVDLATRAVDVDVETGEFTAYLSTPSHEQFGWISRRVRTDKPWKISVPQFQIFWSTTNFDWTAVAYVSRLDDDAVHRLQHWLHPNDAVAGTPRVAPHPES